MDDTSAFYRHVLSSAADGMWLVGLDGTTAFVNERAASLLARSVDELSATPVEEVLVEVGGVPFADRVAFLVETDPAPGEVEGSCRLPDGRRLSLLVAESVVRDEHGRPAACLLRLTAGSRRRALVHELSRSREQLDEAQAMARIGSWELDLTTEELTWSRQMFAMFGVDQDGFVPTWERHLECIAEPDRAMVAERVRKARDGNGELELDARTVRADGSIGWLRHRGRIVVGDEGTPLRLGGTVQDVTESKETELQLTDAVVLNAMMQLTATAANEAKTLIEAMLAIRELLLGHDDWQRAVVYRVVEGIGLEPVLFPGDGLETAPRPEELEIAERVLTESVPLFEEEARPQAPSIAFPVVCGGRVGLVVVATACSPFERHEMLRSMAEQVAGHLGRVAEREEAAAELAAARDEAMEGSRLKSQFVATMSHEIRTPMNGVIGLNELLLRTELDERQLGLARGVQAAGQTLLGLINDVLDFSKIESGELVLEVVDFDLRSVFDQCHALLASAAAEKGIELSVEVSEQLPRRVVGDPMRLGQVVSNLMSNAVKFTSEGSVVVRVLDEDPGAFEPLIRVFVEDTGVGVPREQQARLFDPFRQADASTTRTFGGTGLGLAICSQLVGALGGELGVISAPGEGSTFWFTARLGRAEAATEPRTVVQLIPESSVQQSGHVLVVEDNDINQMVAVGLLEALGYTAEVAESGDEAVALAAERAYDAILMDLQMPRMDGYAAARLIRSQEPEGRRVPIVAMTASAVEGERERCTDAGMDDFLTKPVDSARMGTVLSKHIAHRAAHTPEATAAAPVSLMVGSTLARALDESRLDELAEMGGRAVALVNRAIDNFVHRLPSTLDEIEQAIDAEDWQAFRSLVHRFRGSALNLGASTVGEIALELELLEDDELPRRGAQLLGRLQEASAEAVVALQDYQARRTRASA